MNFKELNLGQSIVVAKGEAKSNPRQKPKGPPKINIPTGPDVKKQEEQETVEKVDTQNKTIEQVQDALAAMNEIAQVSLKGAKPEIKELADQIVQHLTTLSQKLTEHVSEDAIENG